MTMIRAAPPTNSLLRRRICGIAAVRSRPPFVPSGVPSSIEPGGDEQKAGRSKASWRRRLRIARSDTSSSLDAWTHTRQGIEAKRRRDIGVNASARVAADVHHARAGDTTRRRAEGCKALRGGWPQKYDNFWQTDPRRPRRTRQHAPAAARTRRPWDGLPGVAVGDSDNGSCCLRFFWLGGGARQP